MPRAWAAWLGAACSVAAPTTSLAQTTASVDLGVSTVRYDGFLPSGAAAVAPSLRWERPGGSLTAQATYLRFESGNVSVQGNLTGSLFTAPVHRWRGQLLATAGASSYAEFATFRQVIGEARLHRLGDRSGTWLGVTAGRASFGAPRAHPVTGLAIAGWAQRAGFQLFGSATRAIVGDTAYTDIEAAARTRRSRVVLEGYAGARVWSRGGGRGVYGEGSATIVLGASLSLVLSGGRYPTDPIRGSISGRYAGVALRLHSAAPSRPASRDPPWSPPVGTSNGASREAAPFEILPERERAVRLVVRAPDATLVEIAGDFTDWQPVALGRGSGDIWELVLHIPSGIHRIAVRVNGGPWTAPPGARRADDDFGGEVGIFVVP